MNHPVKIYRKGHVVKFEPTPTGRKRAAELVTLFPASCSPVAKTPHYIELLTDFAFGPVVPETAQRLAHFNPE
ncbi:MAG: hypothetical protein P4L99_21740 [Chthoniobacter sp.]|nr:hypothetical protein [Chthoniobacter sp.]